MKRNKILRTGVLVLLPVAALVSCNRGAPIYEATPEALHNGSLYYAVSQYNCVACHGTDWKGSGPEAKGLTAQGITLPDFTAPLSPEKTPLDYFKAMTVGTEKTKLLPNGHAFQSHTDRARWAMANFLYLQGQPSSDESKRKASVEAAMKEVRKTYDSNRKWYMGDNKPSAEREKAPGLSDLLSKAGFTPDAEPSIVPVTDARRAAAATAREEHTEGFLVYQANCQKCHGIFGEGAQGAVSLVGLTAEGEGWKGIPRRKAVQAPIPDLADRTLSAAALRSAHEAKHYAGQSAYGLTEEQWEQLSDYLKSITGK